MSKIYLAKEGNCDEKIGSFLEKFSTKVGVYPPGTCPLTVQLALLQAGRSQTCGKCVPCRDGLRQLEKMLFSVICGDATLETLDAMKELATMIRDTADCAIGYQAAADMLEGMDVFKNDYVSHIEKQQCYEDVTSQKIPCVELCPAHVDIPGYIGHVQEGNYADAINLIRKDNPLPTTCAMICEHPCENRCRRNLIDSSLNIRGVKKYAVDQIAADKVEVPKACPKTGKKIAIIGGGPCGMTAAYYLSLMGHECVVYEAKEKLGGMLLYGIPNYRFPKDRLEEDMNAILSTGNIEVKYGVNVGVDVSIEEIYNSYDAMFVAIGAQAGKTLRMEGSDAKNIYSAVEMLDEIGHNRIPDYTGKSVAVIGGGNVAMDAARSALRCGAKDVTIVYRRRSDDMTALPAEVEASVAEGIELMTLQAPVKVEKDADGNCAGLWVQPQMIGPCRGGRPAPMNAVSKEQFMIPCEVLLIAVGQDIVSQPWEEFGIPAKWNILQAGLDTQVKEIPGVFTGGDCATGPSTVIRAIAAGKVAAHNIDEYLGYHHTLDCGVKAPEAIMNNRVPTGRVNIQERPANERKHDFEYVEIPLTAEEMAQECSRCLRCDVFGCGKMEV